VVARGGVVSGYDCSSRCHTLRSTRSHVSTPCSHICTTRSLMMRVVVLIGEVETMDVEGAWAGD
jgi:hypothetical protein